MIKIFLFFILVSVLGNQVVFYYFPNSNECEGDFTLEKIDAYGCRESMFQEKQSLTADCRDEILYDGILGIYKNSDSCKFVPGNYTSIILDFNECIDVDPYLKTTGIGSIMYVECIYDEPEPEKN